MRAALSARVTRRHGVVWKEFLPSRARPIARRRWSSIGAAPPMRDCGRPARSLDGTLLLPRTDQKSLFSTLVLTNQIATRFGRCDVGSKSCQFAQAYVIAHEIGHQCSSS